MEKWKQLILDRRDICKSYVAGWKKQLNEKQSSNDCNNRKTWL